MNRDVELVILTGSSYEASRSNINKIPVPEGWSRLIQSSWPAETRIKSGTGMLVAEFMACRA